MNNFASALDWGLLGVLELVLIHSGVSLYRALQTDYMIAKLMPVWDYNAKSWVKRIWMHRDCPTQAPWPEKRMRTNNN